MTKVPGRYIPTAVPRSPEVEVRPLDLGLSGAGGVEGSAGVAVQEHVIPSRLDALNRGRLRHGAATASGAHQQSGTALLVPEKVRAAEMQAAKVEQAAARYRKQGGMADQQLGAVLLSGGSRRRSTKKLPRIKPC